MHSGCWDLLSSSHQRGMGKGEGKAAFREGEGYRREEFEKKNVAFRFVFFFF